MRSAEEALLTAAPLVCCPGRTIQTGEVCELEQLFLYPQPPVASYTLEHALGGLLLESDTPKAESGSQDLIGVICCILIVNCYMGNKPQIKSANSTAAMQLLQK